MNYICHRVNTIEELKDIPFEYGVELSNGVLRAEGTAS